jgi:uncharacterized protein (UPF0261 family)
MRALPIGVPKLIISSVASGDVGPYVGPADITMMYSVTDVQGLNSISRAVLANGAHALIGMVKARLDDRSSGPRDAIGALPSIGITMFGVTTPAVQKIAADLKDDFECLVFHATGVGGRSMEKLVDSGQLAGVIDLTTTEVCDLLMGGVFPATEDRFGATIRSRVPYVGSVGALDMVNFGAPDTIPSATAAQIPRSQSAGHLMRTTPEENERMGAGSASGSTRWTGRCASSCPKAASPRSTRRASRSGTRKPTRRCFARWSAPCARPQPPAHPRHAHINDPEFAPRSSARSAPARTRRRRRKWRGDHGRV